MSKKEQVVISKQKSCLCQEEEKKKISKRIKEVVLTRIQKCGKN